MTREENISLLRKAQEGKRIADIIDQDKIGHFLIQFVDGSYQDTKTRDLYSEDELRNILSEDEIQERTKIKFI